MHTSPWTNIKHIISLANGLFIVFNDDYGIALIAQVFKGRQQTVVVTLVQAN